MHGSGQGPSPDALPIVESTGHNGRVDQICITAFGRLLCLVAAWRAHHLESVRLHDSSADWARNRPLHTATAGQESHSRARMQIVRLDVPYVVSFSLNCFKLMQPEQRNWSHAINHFWTCLQHTLRAVTGSPDLCVPSSLRPGGATFWFREWDKILLKMQW